MENKRYRPLVDKLYFIIFVPVAVLVIGSVIVNATLAPTTLFLTIPVAIFTLYFAVTSLFGYVELRDECLYIKYGLILKREIPYSQIRGVEKHRRFYSDTMLSLKNSFEHINIKYNKFDVTAVSVVDNDSFMEDLLKRING